MSINIELCIHLCYNYYIMNIETKNNNLIISDVKDFNLKHIFECGQCFRWNKESDGSYTGIAYGKVLTIMQTDSSVTLFNTTEEDFKNIWYNYFDFGNDYGSIKTKLSSDKILKDAIGYGEGIRILNQELWECVISFIISASNNIPRIKKIINSLCENFGNKTDYRGKTYYSFPSPEKIYSLSLEDLAPIKAGFRDKYIISAAKAFHDGLSAETFKDLSYAEAKKELMKIKGIGNKVADCILLFGLSKRNSFPIDVWIKRIVEYCYFDQPQSIGEIERFSSEKFGELGGYAQQYLFFYARENKIGLK